MIQVNACKPASNITCVSSNLKGREMTMLKYEFRIKQGEEGGLLREPSGWKLQFYLPLLQHLKEVFNFAESAEFQLDWEQTQMVKNEF